MSRLKTQQIDLFPTQNLQVNLLYASSQACDSSILKDSLLLAGLETSLDQYHFIILINL